MTEKRARVSREVWAKRVERWGDSGLTAAEFARELGINASTLTYWKYTLGKESNGAAKRAEASTPKPRPAAAAETAFVRVDAPTHTERRFELELPGGQRVWIPMGFDETSLRRLVSVLGAAS